MRNQLQNLIFGKNSTTTVLILFAFFAFVGLGCRFGGNAETKPIPSAYLGDWEGQDGTTLSIRADGKGDYRSGNTKLEGATAEIDEAAKTVSVTFLGMGKTLKIDEPPAGDRMKLDGITFRRKGGFSTSTTGDSSSDTTSNSSSTKTIPFPSDNDSASSDAPTNSDAPTKSEVESLVKETMAEFATAVRDEDFSEFHANSSQEFQASYTPDYLKTVFQTYLDNKNVVLPVLNSVDNASAAFSEGPIVRQEKGLDILVANGSFPTRPRKAQFETEYKMQDGAWKIMKFKIKM